MNTCSTCIYWERLTGDRLGKCTEWLYGYGVRDEDIPDYGILVEDDEGWGMKSGPEFGCVLWEGRDE